MATQVKRPWRRAGKKRIALAAGSLVLALILAYAGLAAYKAFSYTTTPAQQLPATTPADLGLSYEEVAFPSAANDGVTLRGWWIPHPNSQRALILVHGRYENRASYLALARPLWDQGYSVLLFDLRGHGRSTPAPCAYGLREQWDVVAAAEFVRAAGVPASGVGVLGWSLGGASALMAASQTSDIAAVATDSAYANADPLLARNPLRPGLRLALKLIRGVDLTKVAPEKAIRQLGDRPVLVIHGQQDRAVPVAQAYRLQRAAGTAQVALWIVPDAGHVQAYPAHPDEYLARVIAFFDGALS